MRRILLSLLVIISVAGATIQLSSAFFSDTETSANNTFTAGTIDLKVNGTDNPEAIVNFNNLLPGGTHDEDKELRVIDNDAYVWMHIKDVQTGPGGDPTQPEADEEAGLGGPKDNINDYMKYSFALDSVDFFNEPINFNDAVSCWIPLGTLTGGQTVNMVQSFHLDAGVTNWAQGDTMSFTEEFYAEQFDNNPNPAGPVSLTGRVWSQQEGKCVDSLELVDIVNVAANSTTPTLSNFSSENGMTYKIKAIGTADAGDTIIFDAEYSKTNRISGDNWTDDVTGYESDGPNLLDLMVNGTFVNWGAYNEDHIYWYETTGNGGAFTFKINDTFPSNNSGSITVEVYKVN